MCGVHFVCCAVTLCKSWSYNMYCILMSGTEGSASSPWRARTENRRWTLYRKCMEEGNKKLTKLPCNSIVYFPAERAVRTTSGPCLVLVLEKLWSFGLSHVFKNKQTKKPTFLLSLLSITESKERKVSEVIFLKPSKCLLPYLWLLPCAWKRGRRYRRTDSRTQDVRKCCSFTKVMPNRAVSWKL